MVRPRASLLLLAAALTAACGCGFSKRPYSHDPLLRDGAAIWGNSGLARERTLGPNPEPVAPHAPRPPLLVLAGDPLTRK